MATKEVTVADMRRYDKLLLEIAKIEQQLKDNENQEIWEDEDFQIPGISIHCETRQMFIELTSGDFSSRVPMIENSGDGSTEKAVANWKKFRELVVERRELLERLNSAKEEFAQLTERLRCYAAVESARLQLFGERQSQPRQHSRFIRVAERQFAH